MLQGICCSSPSGLREELSAGGDTPIRFLKDQYRPSYRLYGGVRGMPDGRERWSSMSPVPSHCISSSPSCEDMLFSAAYRDSSVDSLAGLASSYEDDSCGMQDLVQQAREVRRLIREVSLDSDASDLSLADFGLGRSGGCGEEVSQLLGADMCRNSSPDMSCCGREGSMDSDWGMGRDDMSCPDIAGLRSMRRSSQNIWRLTHFPTTGGRDDSSLYNLSRHGSIASNSSLLEWESPVIHHQQGWHDVKPVKLALHSQQQHNFGSANVSEYGGDDAASGLDPWEWDNDDVCYFVEGEPVMMPEDEDEQQGVRPHSSWLPDENTELDLETELRLGTIASCDGGGGAALRRNSLASLSSSRRSSVDMLCMRRLPPSGRSSMEREPSSSSSCVVEQQQLANVANSSRTGSKQQPHHHYHHHHHRRQRYGSVSSDESGYLEGEASLTASSCSMTASLLSNASSSGPMETSSINSSCLFTSSINLSPVKEARDEPAVSSSSPTMKQAASLSSSPVSGGFLSPSIRFGDITTTDTVIKISVPVDHMSRRDSGAAAVHRQLFQE